jgi:hypothetical protein
MTLMLTTSMASITIFSFKDCNKKARFSGSNNLSRIAKRICNGSSALSEIFDVHFPAGQRVPPARSRPRGNALTEAGATPRVTRHGKGTELRINCNARHVMGGEAEFLHL